MAVTSDRFRTTIATLRNSEHDQQVMETTANHNQALSIQIPSQTKPSYSTSRSTTTTNPPSYTTQLSSRTTVPSYSTNAPSYTTHVTSELAPPSCTGTDETSDDCASMYSLTEQPLPAVYYDLPDSPPVKTKFTDGKGFLHYAMPTKDETITTKEQWDNVSEVSSFRMDSDILSLDNAEYTMQSYNAGYIQPLLARNHANDNSGYVEISTL